MQSALRLWSQGQVHSWSQEWYGRQDWKELPARKEKTCLPLCQITAYSDSAFAQMHQASNHIHI